MTPDDRVGALVQLLERVKRHAKEPRVPRAGQAVAAGEGAVGTASQGGPSAASWAPPIQVPTEPVAFPPPHTAHAPEPRTGFAGPSTVPTYAPEPPAVPVSSPPAGAAAYSSDDDDAVLEISAEPVEIELGPDESGFTVPSEPPEVPATFTMPLAGSPPPTLLADEEVEAPFANEVVEPAPSSSRRPIADDLAFEEERRHTPPPESGKQVSVAPSAPSEPPPSLDERTLIGGWREPGLGVAHVSTGVRVPAPSREIPATRANVGPLSPDVMRPVMPTQEDLEIAAFRGSVPLSKPATLGDLLDMTLAL